MTEISQRLPYPVALEGEVEPELLLIYGGRTVNEVAEHLGHAILASQRGHIRTPTVMPMDDVAFRSKTRFS